MKLMKKSGQILGLVLGEIEKTIRAGMTTKDIDLFAEQIIRDQGGHPSFKGYRGFPASVCISINEEVVHGIPGDRVIREGDVVTVDCGVTYQGLITDSAITVGVGKITPDAQKLIRTAYKALDKALSIARPGIRTTELSKVIEETVRKQNFGIVEDLSGHGVGFSLHEDPFILNFYDNHPGPIMRPGMTLAIEPIITMGSAQTKTLKDGWTIVTKSGCLAVQVEHTIAITEKGAEILTKRPK
jgi:methionyl aminopeptidase